MRVVCLYGGLTETVVALERGDTLVARTQADKTPDLVDLPSVGTHMRPNLELIAGLAPDLVLQQGGRTEALEVVADLERLGVPVALFNPSSFHELFDTMQRLGVLLDARAQSLELVSGLQARLDSVSQALMNGPADASPLVVFEIRYPNLLCAGQASMVSEIVQRAGGANAVQAPGKVIRLSEEELIRLDPQAYVIQQGPMNPNPAPLAERPLFRDLACAANTLVVDEALFSRPGPRSVLAVEQLARFLHPQCFPQHEEQ